MRMHAEVVCVYGDGRTSMSVASAVSPDNMRLPEGLEISSAAEGPRVKSVVRLDGRAETMLATLDDLLACIVTAESVL